jgi:hypothetical protein
MSFNVIWSEHFSLSHLAWELSGSTGWGKDNVNRLKQTMGIFLSIKKIFYYFGERQSRNDFVISKIISANFVSGNWILT